MERIYENAISARGTKLPDWPEWCYAPLAVAYAAVSEAAEEEGLPMQDAVVDVGNVGALAAWRMTKTEYRFSDTLLKEFSDAELKEIPCEYLIERLPEWCVYVDAAGQNWSVPKIDGFFAYLEADSNDGHAELRITFSVPDGLFSFAIHLVNGSLADGLMESSAWATQFIPSGKMATVPTEQDASAAAELLKPLVCAVLYLCSEEPDIHPPRTRAPHPLHPYRTVNHYQVGFSAMPDTLGNHKSPRAHIRRAHWHIYRTGKGKTGMSVKWVHATPVGF